MRRIDLIIIHCADTYASMDIGAKDIDVWHKQRGWKGIGYHYVIKRNGKIETGRPESEVGAHVTGHNRFSIGICWVGGKGDDNKPQDNRTNEQKQALRSLINGLHSKYPNAIIAGHNDFTNLKACPCFNVQAEFGWLNAKNNSDEREIDKSMEVVEREENKHRIGNLSGVARRKSFRPEPIEPRTSRFHTDGRSVDSRLWANSQGSENELSAEFYEDKIEKSIRSQIKWEWGFSIPIQKIINFFKQLKRR